MIFKWETLWEREARLKPWHRWFAWRPVFIPGTGIVWLQHVERSGHIAGFMYEPGIVYDYRLPK